jgi:hypothetical protein
MNAVTVFNANTAIEVPADYVPVAGIENLSPDDFSLPVLKLVQANTKIDNAEELIGQWYRTDTGEAMTNPNLIMIGIAKQRILFASEYSGEGKALCRSDNGQTPRIELIGTTLDVVPGNEKRSTIISEGPGSFIIPPTCAECELSQWTLGKPPCKLSDNWAAVTSDGDPVVIRFGGSAAKMGAKLRNLARAATMKRKPLYIALGSHLEQGTSGNYYVPDILTATAPLSPDLIEMAKAFAGVNLAARADDLRDEEAQPQTVTRTSTPNDENLWDLVEAGAAGFSEEIPF